MPIKLWNTAEYKLCCLYLQLLNKSKYRFSELINCSYFKVITKGFNLEVWFHHDIISSITFIQFFFGLQVFSHRRVARDFIMLKPIKNKWRIKRYLT